MSKSGEILASVVKAEYLVSRGFEVVATDINESALEISRSRCNAQGRSQPEYVCCSGLRLPFADSSFAVVLFVEALHHMPAPEPAIAEAFRVLRPGGIIVGFEPYALDPWRRVSEVRDYFRGSIETSYTVTSIRRMLREADFAHTNIVRFVDPPSTAKLEALSPVRQVLRKSYHRLRSAMVELVGMIEFTACKPGNYLAPDGWTLEASLRCPITGEAVRVDGDYIVAIDSGIRYPYHEGIPRLLVSDALW